MGLSDREYFRDEQPGGFQMGGPRTLVTNLILINVAVYVACNLVAPWLTERLSLHGDLFASPDRLLYLYQLVTYGFVHAPLDARGGAGIFHILLNMYILWMFGRPIEERYGRAEFLRLYMVLIVFAGLLWLIRQTLMGTTPAMVHGASGAVTGIVILFCLHYPQQTLALFGVINMRAWVLAVLLLSVDLLRALDPNSHVAWDAHLAGALLAFLYHRFDWNFSRFTPQRKPRIGQRLKRKPQLKIHDPDQYYDSLDEEADRVLDKLHREGEASLTPKERKVLEDYSRRMRQKHR
jgi:membrane associated rhomboid family serine protease